MQNDENFEQAGLEIENERLKTSLVIMSQQMRSQEMNEELLREKDLVIKKLSKENV